MALQMVRSFFGQGTPSRSRVHEPVIGIESLGNQEGNTSYDRGDVGKSAASNWFELARHPTSELGRKPHTYSSSRSSKVDDFGTNRKHIFDFLLVISSNLVLACTVSEIRRLIF